MTVTIIEFTDEQKRRIDELAQEYRERVEGGMRQAARIDANQSAIVEALRKVGATVQILSAVGKGCPDIMVGRHGCNYLFEIKDGDKPPSKRALTPDEVEWHETWRGEVLVVESVEDALRAVGANE